MKNIIIVLTLLIGFGSLAQDKLGDGIYAIFKTSKGEIVVSLEYQKVPLTVANFVGLAEGNLAKDTVKITSPFYDGLKFHRVIKDFMVQGGDPKGNGSGNPGYFFPDEFDTSLTHSGPGILSMANSGPNTNGSQFFITHKATPWLNMKHSIFGKVIKGQDIVDKIEQDDIIETLTISRIGKAAKKFKAAKVFQAELDRLEAEIAEIAETRNATFKAEMSTKYPNAEQTESGLMYIHTTVGEGDLPEAGDQIELHYTGYLSDGTKFESSYDREKPFKFIYKTNHVLPGWEEALAIMKQGGEMKIVMPPWLGFGAQGKGAIPPNETLTFDLVLVSVKDIEAETKRMNKEFYDEMIIKYPAAKQTKSGLMYIVQKEGNGTFAQAGQTVVVHYTGTLTDGSKFDSSKDRNQPFEFPIGQGRVIKGWDEGIPLASIEGQILLIIPYWLAYGETAKPSIPANSHLIFDVEMIGVK